ncbi:hypothetical protein FLK61_36465 [Paenalkalicoccus suaedae]|uniref:Uncharacterized protein n=1 Tax=Paenalkalicoccus suaedae TaxID=2592382 RepID=A0A859FHK3_9BACI|nr:hypothetical protein [Paenalkalicoccus suaedae]QKS72154.1 hypothetical protein FLK61_36465 [Paenalkalicoccus suaedae]
MSKHIVAYFNTENDAESALASLRKVGVMDERVDMIPEEGRGQRIIMPATNLGSGGGGLPGHSGAFAAITNIKETFTGKDEKHPSYALEFSVEDSRVDDAIHVLKESDAYVDKSLTVD